MGSAVLFAGDPETVAGAAAPDEITPREGVGETQGSPGTGPGADPPPRLLVNKRELARRVLNISLPTLNDLIDRHADFPVVTRGAPGVEWQFDPVAVTQYLAAQSQADAAASAARAEQLQRQFAIPLDEVAGDVINESPTQRLIRNRNRVLEQKLAREAGDLLLAGAALQRWEGVIGRLARFLEGLPAELAREFNLPDQVATAMRQRIDERRAQFVADLTDHLDPDGELAI